MCCQNDKQCALLINDLPIDTLCVMSTQSTTSHYNMFYISTNIYIYIHI